MAFAEHRRTQAERLREGDRLFLYTTRGCFRNPTRDRGRIIGVGYVTGALRHARRSIEFDGRVYPYEMPLAIEALSEYRQGMELAPLVAGLSETFPVPHAWSALMRRPLVPVSRDDASKLLGGLDGLLSSYEIAARSYRAAARRSSTRGRGGLATAASDDG
jgi:hypothetical protein